MYVRVHKHISRRGDKSGTPSVVSEVPEAEKDARSSAADIIMINYNTLRAEYQTATTRHQVVRAL